MQIYVVSDLLLLQPIINHTHLPLMLLQLCTSMWCTFANHLLTNVQMGVAHTSAYVYLREVWLGVGLLPPPDCVRVFGSGWETEFGGRGGDRISRETE